MRIQDYRIIHYIFHWNFEKNQLIASLTKLIFLAEGTFWVLNKTESNKYYATINLIREYSAPITTSLSVLSLMARKMLFFGRWRKSFPSLRNINAEATNILLQCNDIIDVVSNINTGKISIQETTLIVSWSICLTCRRMENEVNRVEHAYIEEEVPF